MKALALVVMAGLLLAGCSTTTPDDGRVRVVASTNVYGGIAEAVGGNLVDVTSIIDDPSQDPHSYEGTARVQLALSRADVVIENGGGYDDFVDTLLAGTGNSTVTVMNVAQISGKDTTGDFNEHLWYDFRTMSKLVAQLVPTLAAASPGNASVFENNAQVFIERLASLEGHASGIYSRYAGTKVIVTEPVPGYLLAACGLKVVTPPALSRAIEAGTDVPPAALQDTVALLEDYTARVLVYNEQTTGPQTEQVMSAALAMDAQIVGVTETMPTGTDYISWMNRNLNSLDSALHLAHKAAVAK